MTSQNDDRKVYDNLITLEDIKGLPKSEFPKMVLANGYMSVFGFLISLGTKDFWNHFMWLISPEEVATQWWWFRKMKLDHFSSHSLKIWDNPAWTSVEKAVILQFIDVELGRGKWATRYDVIGLLAKAMGRDVKNDQDFCSEKIDILAFIDSVCLEWLSTCSPRPEEVNRWLKEQGRFRVFGRVQPS